MTEAEHNDKAYYSRAKESDSQANHICARKLVLQSDLLDIAHDIEVIIEPKAKSADDHCDDKPNAAFDVGTVISSLIRRSVSEKKSDAKNHNSDNCGIDIRFVLQFMKLNWGLDWSHTIR